MIRRLALSAVMLALFPISGQSDEVAMNSTMFQQSSAATKAEVLKHIPIGTPIEQARAFMEANGFRCQSVQNQKFAEDGPSAGRQITHGPANFLWCDSGERTFRLVLSRRWQITFVNVGGKVSYVAVGVGVSGP